LFDVAPAADFEIVERLASGFCDERGGAPTMGGWLSAERADDQLGVAGGVTMPAALRRR
jgi:hypothetical protein